MSTAVVIAAGGAAWESSLLAAIDTDDLEMTVVRRCMDVVELVSVSLAGAARVALISAELRQLDADIVDQLALVGVVPVAVVRTETAETLDALRAKGIRHVVAADADATVIAAVVREAAAEPGPTETTRAFALPGPRRVTPPQQAEEPSDLSVPPAAGAVLAVWGPTGAPGRTTVAVALADEIARLGAEVVLVDADVYGGTIAMQLGILDESPGLAAACRATSGPRRAMDTLTEFAWQLSPRLRVVTGLPLPQRWPEIRPSALTAFLGACRSVAEWTVIDLGFSIEADEELSFDSIAPRRNGATLAALDEADVVVVVGQADPVGIQRLASALLELEEVGLASDATVVLNKVRPGFGSGEPATTAMAAAQRFTGRTPIACLPYDRAAMDACAAAGRSLADVRSRSRLRQATAQLARDVTGLKAARHSRRHARA